MSRSIAIINFLRKKKINVNVTIANGKKIKTDTLFVECAEKSWDFKTLATFVFVQDVKRKKKDIKD